MNTNIKNILKISTIAAIYVVITYLIQPISFLSIQFRISEVLILFAFIDKRYIPGLTLGCFIANLASPLGPIDYFLGSFATFLATSLIYYTGQKLGNNIKSLYISSLWAALVNGIIIGYMLHITISLPLTASIISVLLSEFFIVTIIGCSLFSIVLKKEYLLDIFSLDSKHSDSL